MKEILESIILNIVEKQDQVYITQKEEENSLTFVIKVAQEDMGRVIGKQGRVAKAIRVVAKSLAAKEHKKVMVEFVD